MVPRDGASLPRGQPQWNWKAGWDRLSRKRGSHPRQLRPAEPGRTVPAEIRVSMLLLTGVSGSP